MNPLETKYSVAEEFTIMRKNINRGRAFIFLKGNHLVRNISLIKSNS